MHSKEFGITQVFAFERGFFFVFDMLDFGIDQVCFHFAQTVLFGFADNFSRVIEPMIGEVIVESHVQPRGELFASVRVETFDIFGSLYAFQVALHNFLGAELSGRIAVGISGDVELSGEFLFGFVAKVALHGGLFVVIFFVQFLGVILKF